MNGEHIGYADLNMNGTGYNLYEVYRDHTQKCIVIREVAEMEDFFLPHFGHDLPRYDVKVEVHRQKSINAAKKHKAPLRSPVRRTYGNSTGRQSRNLTTASRPDLSHIKDAPRSMGERKPSKQMSQAEVKRLLADALGMEVDE